MKIEIDLNDILGDEYGAESLNDSIKRQVIENITKTVEAGIKKQINEEVSKAIQENLVSALDDKMPLLIDDLMNAEYQPVDNYGSRKPITNFRNELIKSIMEQMTYKKQNYSDKENFFTKAVDAVISEQMRIIAADYKKTVDEFIGKEAFNLAIKTLKTKLGLEI
jgi:hypothetical protein